MVTKVKLLEAVKLLNEAGLSKIKTVAIKEEDMKDAFMSAIDALIAEDRIDEAPKKVKAVYNQYVEEENGEVEEVPEVEEEVKEEKPKAKKESAKKKEKPVEEEVKDVAVYDDQQEITLENCPDDYETLKEQSKKLVVSSAMSFMLLGQRLAKIRDKELYKEDGYSNFKQFIDAELSIGKSHVYNAIDLVTYFGVQSIGNQQLNPSTLIQALPLLKANDEVLSKADKKEVKSTILKEAKTKSEREMKNIVKDLKVKYGMAEEKKEVNKMDAAFARLMSVIPDERSASDVKKIQKYIKKLEDLIG